MTKDEIIYTLKKTFESESTAEVPQDSRRIENTTNLIPDSSNITNPDFDVFVALLRGQNTRDSNYVAALLTSNRSKIFKEYSLEERADFLETLLDYRKKLLFATKQTKIIVEYEILTWASSLFKLEDRPDCD